MRGGLRICFHGLQEPEAGYWVQLVSAEACTGPCHRACCQHRLCGSGPSPCCSSLRRLCPDGTVVGAAQVVGRVTGVSGGQPTVPKQQPGQPGTAASAGQEPAPVLPLAAGPAQAPAQAQPAAAQPQARDSASSAGPSQDPSNPPNTPDKFYSAALAATAYVSESGASPMPGPALAPRQQLTVPGVTSYGQMLGGRKRLRA